MDDSNGTSDNELRAIQSAYKILEPLDDESRARIIQYLVARLKISLSSTAPTQFDGLAGKQETLGNSIADEEEGSSTYSSFAELYDAAQPSSGPAMALTAGYWLQVCKGAESFDGFSANRELKNLGHGIANITKALERAKDQKPALVLQLKKSGKSRQARKVYKVTVAGVRRVEEMIESNSQGDLR